MFPFDSSAGPFELNICSLEFGEFYKYIDVGHVEGEKKYKCRIVKASMRCSSVVLLKCCRIFMFGSWL